MASLHQALKIMIVDVDKGRLQDEFSMEGEPSTCSYDIKSYPLDLSKGNNLQRALQIMKGKIKKYG
jgi:hypothetical protein